MKIVFKYKSRVVARGVDEGINPKWLIETESIGKDRSENFYLIANEWIAGCIGQFLRLPIPPFAMMEGYDSRTRMFASLSFGVRGAPSDCDADILFEKHPQLCTGVVVFDALVANYDRHSRNIKVDNPDNPKMVYVFDHDRALFGGFAERYNTRRHFENLKDDPYLGPDHVLRYSITTQQHFADWINAVKEMPDRFIARICEEARDCGLNKTEINSVRQFIKYRRDNLERMLFDNRNWFENVNDWGLFL